MKSFLSLTVAIVAGIVAGIFVFHYQEHLEGSTSFRAIRTMGEELFPKEEIADLRIILFRTDGTTKYPDYDLRIESEGWDGVGLYRFRLLVDSQNHPLVHLRQIRPFAAQLLEQTDERTGCKIFLHYPRSPYFNDEGLGLLFLAAQDLPEKSCALDSPRYNN